MSEIFNRFFDCFFVTSRLCKVCSFFKEDRHGHLNDEPLLKISSFRSVRSLFLGCSVHRFYEIELKLPSTLLVNRFVFRSQSAVHTRSISMISNLKIIPISFVKTHRSQNSFHSSTISL